MKTRFLKKKNWNTAVKVSTNEDIYLNDNKIVLLNITSLAAVRANEDSGPIYQSSLMWDQVNMLTLVDQTPLTFNGKRFINQGPAWSITLEDVDNDSAEVYETGTFYFGEEILFQFKHNPTKIGNFITWGDVTFANEKFKLERRTPQYIFYKTNDNGGHFYKNFTLAYY